MNRDQFVQQLQASQPSLLDQDQKVSDWFELVFLLHFSGGVQECRFVAKPFDMHRLTPSDVLHLYGAPLPGLLDQLLASPLLQDSTLDFQPVSAGWAPSGHKPDWNSYWALVWSTPYLALETTWNGTAVTL